MRIHPSEHLSSIPTWSDTVGFQSGLPFIDKLSQAMFSVQLKLGKAESLSISLWLCVGLFSGFVLPHRVLCSKSSLLCYFFDAFKNFCSF